MNYFAKKEENKKRAREHTENMQKRYANRIAESVKDSRIYGGEDEKPGFITKADRDQLSGPKVIFANTDSVSALFEHGEGKTAILNFASYKNPGGMFYEGSMAQEESLCHHSTLYNILRDFPAYYAWNNAHKNKALYLDRAIYTPKVVFEKGGKALLADVITCAAPNYSAAKRYKMADKDENEILLHGRIAFVRDVVETEGAKTLITGAFGCGVFGQDASMVAKMSKEIFQRTTISKIIYAVPGKDKNAEAFRKMFS